MYTHAYKGLKTENEIEQTPSVVPGQTYCSEWTRLIKVRDLRSHNDASCPSGLTETSTRHFLVKLTGSYRSFWYVGLQKQCGFSLGSKPEAHNVCRIQPIHLGLRSRWVNSYYLFQQARLEEQSWKSQNWRGRGPISAQGAWCHHRPGRPGKALDQRARKVTGPAIMTPAACGQPRPQEWAGLCTQGSGAAATHWLKMLGVSRMSRSGGNCWIGSPSLISLCNP